MSKRPIFRADHVGSLLRTPQLHEAREKYQDEKISLDELVAVENDSIKHVVDLQEKAGLKIISDGEQRRTFFHVDFLEKIEGVSASISGYEIKFRGGNKDVTLAPPILSVDGKLKRPDEGILIDDYKFLSSVVSEGMTPKIAMPSPSMLHFRGGRDGIDETAYPDMEEFFDDLARVYREEIAELATLGCRYIQLDDTNLAYLCDPAHRKRVQELGEDPDVLPNLYAKLISDSLRDRPDNMTAGIHLCRGNHRSAWAAQGGYEPVADVLFNNIDVDVFYLEYDDERSGGFAPLRHVPKGKQVVLGLLSSKDPELESKEALRERIEEATQYLPLEQCCLSPQCGFASTHEGNDITEQQQLDKLSRVVEVAGEVWGEA